jgi:CheY-like chemotaxis protein
LRVLIAEDDPVSALLARAVLEKLGHDVTDVGTTPLAIQAAGLAVFDIVLVDMQLAEDSGLDVVRALRQTLRGNISIIAMSGSNDIETKLAAEQAGADLYLEKPVSPDVLRRAVEAVAVRRAA